MNSRNYSAGFICLQEPPGCNDEQNLYNNYLQEETILDIQNLSVEVEGRIILKGINLKIAAGETVILFGPNGVGKSSLFMAIMGFPKYKIRKGKIVFNGKDITRLPTPQRAELGIGMSFQRPPSIRGIKLSGLSALLNQHDLDGSRLSSYAQLLKLEDLLSRDINLGFSGGEVKRSEIFQLLLQNPLLSLIDEPESGVDIENISVLGRALKKLLHKSDHMIERKNSGIIITHTGLILNYVNADRGYMVIDGKLTCSGNAREIFELIQQKGYRECQHCLKNN